MLKVLRGGKMEDVIFAGTQFRKPLGLAQVSLTLDNSDGSLQQIIMKLLLLEEFSDLVKQNI